MKNKEFGGYDKIPPKNKSLKYRRYVMNTAIGLNLVDDQFCSKYFKDNIAEKVVNETLSLDQAKKELEDRYDCAEVEYLEDEYFTDLVTLEINELLLEQNYVFTVDYFLELHKRIFSKPLEKSKVKELEFMRNYLGRIRDYEIRKEEPILSGDSVRYTPSLKIKESLEHEFGIFRESFFKRDANEFLIDLINFCSNIWQVHPFVEGNTRVTSVFIQKILVSELYDISNDLFKENSKYFRNALVVNNYSNLRIKRDNKYLISFFECLLYDGNLIEMPKTIV